MTAPTVSVIVPVFNGERFLAAALDSVAAQDYRPIEIIVVDDGSTDATPQILAARSDIRVIRQDNQGPSVARNVGVAHARGDVFAFLDGDDLWRANKLAMQIRDLHANPGHGYNICQCRFFLEPGIEPPKWLLPGFYDLPRVAYLPSALVVRRQTLEAIGGFDPGLRLGEDTDWFARAMERNTAHAVLPEVLLDRRIHGGNLSFELDACLRGALDSVRRAVMRKRQGGSG
ncbi:MAG: glycosyltransferase family 2 protein [Alphaproteobacteria bacterium]